MPTRPLTLCPTTGGRHRSARECGPCRRRRDRERGPRQARGYDREYERERRVVLADATHCAICGRPGTPDDPLTADHRRRLIHGGRARGNLRPAHRSCNSARNSR